MPPSNLLNNLAKSHRSPIQAKLERTVLGAPPLPLPPLSMNVLSLCHCVPSIKHCPRKQTAIFQKAEYNRCDLCGRAKRGWLCQLLIKAIVGERLNNSHEYVRQINTALTGLCRCNFVAKNLHWIIGFCVYFVCNLKCLLNVCRYEFIINIASVRFVYLSFVCQ